MKNRKRYKKFTFYHFSDRNGENDHFTPSIFRIYKVGGIFISFLLKGGDVIWEDYEGVICCSE